MVEDKVVNLARTFRDACLRATAGLPLFEVDMSWPSVGALDFLLFPLRFKERLQQSELNSIHGAAAYMAGLAYDCWSQFPGVEAELKIAPGAELEVTLTAHGGAGLEPGEHFTINVSQALRAVLSKPERPFPFFERASRYLHPNHNLLSLFGIGLFSGLTPYGTGPWKGLKFDTVPHLVSAEQFLARSTAGYCQRVFPHEPLLHQPKFFQSKLILPPAMFRESFPAIEATAAIVQQLKAIGLAEDAIESLALTLLAIPDELISSAAVAVAGALAAGKIPAPLQAASTAKGFYMPQLRPAMMIARELFAKPSDWIKCIDQGALDMAVQLATTEKKLGLLPLLWFPTERLRDPLYREVLEPVAWSDADGTLDAIAKLEAGGALSPELALERIFVWITQEKLELATEYLSPFLKQPPGDMQLAAAVSELCGLVALVANERQAALKHYQIAHQGTLADRQKRQSISANLAWCYMINEQFAEALELLDQILLADPHSVNAKINRAATLDALGRSAEADEELEELQKYASFDRRVFISLIAQRG